MPRSLQSWRALTPCRWKPCSQSRGSAAQSGKRSRSRGKITSTITTTGGLPEMKGNAMQRMEPDSLRNAPRCQARTKRGGSCHSPAVRGKRVCRMHGGTNRGAPKGEANGNWKGGTHTNEAVVLRRAASRLLKAAKDR